jgi:D-aminoacyl-tRNA deacylase
MRLHPAKIRFRGNLAPMRIVIQRVSEAAVKIENHIHASIEKGLLVLACWEAADTVEDLTWMAGRIARLRIFNDENSQMNLSLEDVKGEVLLVSQFTLYASTKKGNRPSYIRAAKPDIAIPLYEKFIKLLEQETGKPVKSGVFAAEMKVKLVNDGPVTIIIDSRNRE